MKRIGLKQEFHGEPDSTQEGISAEFNGQDEVILDVVSGTASFVVPANVPDERVLQSKFIERYLNCTLTMENGAELALWINSGAHGVDVRVRSPKPAKIETEGAQPFSSEELFLALG